MCDQGARGPHMKTRSIQTENGPDVHLNLNVRGMNPSATVAINEHCNALLADGHEVYKLGLGQSPFPVAPSVRRALEQNAFQKDYLAVKGLWELRVEVAKYFRRTEGIQAHGSDILIGPGSKELMFLLQLVYYGDLVIPTPAWVSYAPQANIIGRRVHWLPTLAQNDWKLTPQSLVDLCQDDPDRPRIVILNYPSNPTGGSFTTSELKALAKTARTFRIVLLSDEIYGELHHQGRHVSIARYYPEGTIVSTGLSKWCGAGGWRLGAFLLPQTLRWLLEAMSAVASETFTSTSSPIQYAAVRAFQGGEDIEGYLVHSRKILKHLGCHCHRRLEAAGIHAVRPQGAFYLLPDFSHHRERLARRGVSSSRDLCRRLLDDTGVAVLPGEAFGRPPDELTVRLAYVDFDGAQALAAASEMDTDEPLNGDFLGTFCPNVTTAVERMCEWASG